MNIDSDVLIEFDLKAHTSFDLIDSRHYFYIGVPVISSGKATFFSDKRFLFSDENYFEEKAQNRLKHCIPLPPTIECNAAFKLPALYWALTAFEKIGLELGEALIVLGEHPFKRTFIQTAKWYSAIKVAEITAERNEDEGIHSSSNNERIYHIVDTYLSKGLNTVFLDFSAKPEMIDLLFANLHQWGRCILAGNYNDPLTIDYYNNIHRKGVKVISADFSLTDLFTADQRNTLIFKRAIKILHDCKLSYLL